MSLEETEQEEKMENLQMAIEELLYSIQLHGASLPRGVHRAIDVLESAYENVNPERAHEFLADLYGE